MGWEAHATLLLARFSPEPASLFRLRFFGWWRRRGWLLFFRSRRFLFWLVSLRLLRFRRFLLRLWLRFLAFRLLFSCGFFLNNLLRIHPFDKRHSCRVAFARA